MVGEGSKKERGLRPLSKNTLPLSRYEYLYVKMGIA